MQRGGIGAACGGRPFPSQARVAQLQARGVMPFSPAYWAAEAS
jgi:hypothetical protein